MNIADGLVAWPEDFARRYRELGYWNGKTLDQYLRESAARFGDKQALTDGDIRLSYKELADLSDGLALNLWIRGYRRGDCIVVQLPNCWEFVALVYACSRIGVIPIMALPGHRSNELSYFADHSGAKAIVVPDEIKGYDHQSLAWDVAKSCQSIQDVFVVGDFIAEGSIDLRRLIEVPASSGEAEAILSPMRPNSGDVAVFLLSGGTTGLPKLIPRSHDDYGYNFRQSAATCGFDSDTVYLVALPASHNFPLACPGLLGVLYVGGRVVMARSPEPEYCMGLIKAEGVTVAAAVPAVAQRWLDAEVDNPGHDLSSLKVFQVGGARIAPELARKIQPTLGCVLQQVFGMAEGLLNYTGLTDPEEIIWNTQGRPLSPADEIQIVDDSDNPVPPGEMGQLLTRGPYTLRGYYKAPEHNIRSFTPDGWYRTGDVVRWHPSGNLVVEGRTKDLINRAGEKISAEEVENLIYRLPSVAQVAAISLPDRRYGERNCVVVVLRDGFPDLGLDEIRKAMEDFGVAKYKFPDQLEIVDVLPTTNVGKIDKALLRRQLSERGTT
ncbi:MAG: (2,3-dihydroxybenzoyl)adenylate synthase [Acidimicrobiaceae bacterium]|nr:(2,3-dihydroxybenzoyl)adenylate synthase [Acidimicrobiaceae bacterium]